MLMVEWNMDDALAVRYKEDREESREELQEYIFDLIAQGLSSEEIVKRLIAHFKKAGGN